MKPHLTYISTPKILLTWWATRPSPPAGRSHPRRWGWPLPGRTWRRYRSPSSWGQRASDTWGEDYNKKEKVFKPKSQHTALHLGSLFHNTCTSVRRCIRMQVCRCIRVQVHTCAGVYMCRCIHVYTCVYVCMCIVYTCACVYGCNFTIVQVYKCTSVRKCTGCRCACVYVCKCTSTDLMTALSCSWTELGTDAFLFTQEPDTCMQEIRG